MTVPDERARALVWAGGFLIEVARDKSLPLRIRRQAVSIARHFPTASEVLLAASLFEKGLGGLDLAGPKPGVNWAADCPHGPLTYGTRLRLPEE